MTTPETPQGAAPPDVSAEAPPDVDTAFARDAEQASHPGGARAGGAAAVRDSGWRAWAAVAGVILFLGVSAWFAFDLDRAGSVSFWAYAIGPTALVAAVAVGRAARDGELGDLLRPEWGDASRGLLSAGLLLGASVYALRLLAPVGTARESWTARIYLQLGDPTWLRAHTGLVALLVLVAAAAEEIVWRGLVTRLIAERIGSRFAWVWAALPYALALVPTAWALRDPEAGLNPILVIAGLALGLVWGGLARWTGRLTPSILSHAAFDWCVIMLFRLWGSGV